MPFFFERVQQLSALETGEVVIGQGGAMAVGLAISGRLYDRIGPGALAIAGAILVTVSMFGFTRLTVATTSPLQACIGQQSLTLAMNDTFFLALIGCGICAVAALFVGPDPALQVATAEFKAQPISLEGSSHAN